MRGTPRRVFGLEAFSAQGEGAASGYILGYYIPED
jgi:hypothetical protein